MEVTSKKLGSSLFKHWKVEIDKNGTRSQVGQLYDVLTFEED